MKVLNKHGLIILSIPNKRSILLLIKQVIIWGASVNIKNNFIDNYEIASFVNRWFKSSADVSMRELIGAIRIWKGCN